MRDRDQQRRGEQQQRRRRRRRPCVRLRKRDERGSTGGLTPSTVIPSTSSTSTDGPERVEQLGQHADLDAELPAAGRPARRARPRSKSCARRRSARRRGRRRRRRARSRRASRGPAAVSTARRRSEIRPTGSSAVLGVRLDLARQRWRSRRAVADQQHPLGAAAARTPSAARDRAQHGDATIAITREDGDVAELDAVRREQPVVGRAAAASRSARAWKSQGRSSTVRVADPLHVAVVEAVGLEDDEPGGQRREAPERTRSGCVERPAARPASAAITPSTASGARNRRDGRVALAVAPGDDAAADATAGAAGASLSGADRSRCADVRGRLERPVADHRPAVDRPRARRRRQSLEAAPGWIAISAPPRRSDSSAASVSRTTSLARRALATVSRAAPDRAARSRSSSFAIGSCAVELRREDVARAVGEVVLAEGLRVLVDDAVVEDPDRLRRCRRRRRPSSCCRRSRSAAACSARASSARRWRRCPTGRRG